MTQWTQFVDLVKRSRMPALDLSLVLQQTGETLKTCSTLLRSSQFSHPTQQTMPTRRWSKNLRGSSKRPIMALHQTRNHSNSIFQEIPQWLSEGTTRTTSWETWPGLTLVLRSRGIWLALCSLLPMRWTSTQMGPILKLKFRQGTPTSACRPSPLKVSLSSWVRPSTLTMSPISIAMITDSMVEDHNVIGNQLTALAWSQTITYLIWPLTTILSQSLSRTYSVTLWSTADTTVIYMLVSCTTCSKILSALETPSFRLSCQFLTSRTTSSASLWALELFLAQLSPKVAPLLFLRLMSLLLKTTSSTMFLTTFPEPKMFWTNYSSDKYLLPMIIWMNINLDLKEN